MLAPNTPAALLLVMSCVKATASCLIPNEVTATIELAEMWCLSFLRKFDGALTIEIAFTRRTRISDNTGKLEEITSHSAARTPEMRLILATGCKNCNVKHGLSECVGCEPIEGEVRWVNRIR